MIGDPIDHSRSPAIHTAALAHLGMDGTYTTLRVAAADVGATIERVRSGEFDGLNVTMPHKPAVARLMDRLTPEAERSQSVNTVVRDPDGRLAGHTTDVSALRRLWRSEALPQDRPVLILGAGGAAAAACLAVSGSSVYIGARRPEAATALVTDLGLDMRTLAWGVAVADAVVVNATSLGMRGEELPDRVIDLACAVVDLAYGPAETPAVASARRRGLPVVDGLAVLVAQAADSFRLWTGVEAPVDVMMEAAEADL